MSTGMAVKPLCPELFKLLERAFGRVEIANPGEELVAKRGVDPITRRPCLNVHWFGETYRVNCPFCKDGRQRLWINHTYGQYDPASTAKRQTFFGVCYNENCLKNSTNRERLANMIFGMRNKHNRNPPVILPGRREMPVLGPKPPPGNVMPVTQLPPNHPAVQYLMGKRRISRATLDYYGVGYCIEAESTYRMAYNRIIIPIWFRNEYVGWQARYIDEPPHGVPKYYTCPGMAKSQLLYNFDKACTLPFVVIVEGVTDAWAIGDHAVALLGKTLTLHQRALLQAYWKGKPVILLLDPDARLEMEGMIDLMLSTGNNPVVQILLPEGYDAGDYDHATIMNIIYTQADAAKIPLPR